MELLLKIFQLKILMNKLIIVFFLVFIGTYQLGWSLEDSVPIEINLSIAIDYGNKRWDSFLLTLIKAEIKNISKEEIRLDYQLINSLGAYTMERYLAEIQFRKPYSWVPNFHPENRFFSVLYLSPDEKIDVFFSLETALGHNQKTAKSFDVIYTYHSREKEYYPKELGVWTGIVVSEPITLKYEE